MERRGPVGVAIVGAGGRGTSHARRVTELGGRVVAIAEPVAERRERLGDAYDVPRSARFSGWADLAAAGQTADAAVICTQDRDHVEPCEALAARGYHLLCEKPMAADEAEAERIAEAVERAGVVFAVCHSLRYTPYTDRLLERLDGGAVGDLVSVQNLEPVGWWHFAHSYVRGHWRREELSAPLLMAKSCHDIDWLGYLIGSRPVRVSSFGRLTHFHAENRPSGASDRCVDCAVEPDCPYSAPRLYRSRSIDEAGWAHWPLGALVEDPTEHALTEALASGPYGRCVYTCDNDVVDHQVVALDYENGVTATHTVTAFTAPLLRQTRLFGSHGCIEGDGQSVRHRDFLLVPDGIPPGFEEQPPSRTDAVSAHEDGDLRLIAAFLRAVGTGDRSGIRSGVRESIESHRVVWAAELSRRTGETVRIG